MGIRSSENSQEAVSDARARLREFGLARSGTLKKFAADLGVTAQNLNGYLSGDRNPGRIFLTRLSDLGFDVSVFLGTHKAIPESTQVEHLEVLDLVGIEEILGRSLEAAAPGLGVPAAQVASWRRGDLIPSEQMVRLTNAVVAIALGRLQQAAAFPAPSLPRQAQGAG